MPVANRVRHFLSGDKLPSPQPEASRIPTHWCEDCYGYVDVQRDGSCAACGSRSVVRRRVNLCHVCGGGPDEGELVAGVVHRDCIPTFIRRQGEVVVKHFVGRLV